MPLSFLLATPPNSCRLRHKLGLLLCPHDDYISPAANSHCSGVFAMCRRSWSREHRASCSSNGAALLRWLTPRRKRRREIEHFCITHDHNARKMRGAAIMTPRCPYTVCSSQLIMHSLPMLQQNRTRALKRGQDVPHVDSAKHLWTPSVWLPATPQNLRSGFKRNSSRRRTDRTVVWRASAVPLASWRRRKGRR
jgi:hypothetical protein